MSKQYAIGLMSGTSLDGVDLAYCSIEQVEGKWKYEILAAETVDYDSSWRSKFSEIEESTALDFISLDRKYGNYLGKLTNDFMLKNKIKADFIASHGHTVFHQPEKGITVQIGHGANIAAICKLPVVSDFRSLDVALGGQGAPLVPIGDHLLFNQYDYRLNLGGFANISFEHKKSIIAYDICPVNIIVNKLCRAIGKAYDENGNIGMQGEINEELLEELNRLEFYKLQNQPKSLGKEWLDKTFIPVLARYKISVENKIRTLYEHIAFQIAQASKGKKGEIFVTGGGAHNTFLMARIKAMNEAELIIPDEKTVNYKEALIFAFLGHLRMIGNINTLKSVTGASKDSIGGCIYFG